MKKIKLVLLSVLTILLPFYLLAQDIQEPVKKSITPNTITLILILVILVLLIPVFISGRMFAKAAKFYMIKLKNKSNRTLSSIFLFFFIAEYSNAQSTTAITEKPVDWSAWGLFSCIVLEILIIVYFSLQTNKFLKDSVYSEIKVVEPSKTSTWSKFWEKMNRFKSIEEEGQVDTGHDYDGIRELDNVTPPWFIAGFALSILFAGVYLYRYHVAKLAPLPIEEYKMEMAQAKIDRNKYLSLQADQVDENSVKMLDESGIALGKEIFQEKCIACHEAHGGSKQGGVGPNLTDEYWIHGGSIKNIFTSIKYGWPDKGMISWSNQLSSSQIAQIASFIKSLKGTNPAGAKEKQGDLYAEDLVTSVSQTVDSTNNKK
ncbi:MAG: cbb3-type cytochrome c oxidase N-terminal domain-containing protein [Saprospiraceae bacterium]